MSKKEKGSPEKSKVAPVVTKEMEAKQAEEKLERQKEQAKERGMFASIQSKSLKPQGS